MKKKTLNIKKLHVEFWVMSLCTPAEKLFVFPSLVLDMVDYGELRKYYIVLLAGCWKLSIGFYKK